MSKTQFVEDLKPGIPVNSVFLVTGQRPAYGKGPHKLTLQDRTGKIEGSCWPNTLGWEAIAGVRFAQVEGAVTLYNTEPQVNVTALLPLDEPEDLADFLPRSPRDPKEMWREFKALVKSVSNPSLRELMVRLFRDRQRCRAYREAPAAEFMHHPYIGGLLEHSIEVAKLCDALCTALPALNRDLLIVAALLHDIGKIEELDRTTPAFTRTRPGYFLGHIFLGAQLVDREIRAIENCDPFVADALVHLILSHQGKPEWHSPVEPALLEGYVLHACDQISTKKFYYEHARRSGAGGPLFQKQAGWDGFVYTGDLPWSGAEEVETLPEAPAE